MLKTFNPLLVAGTLTSVEQVSLYKFADRVLNDGSVFDPIQNRYWYSTKMCRGVNYLTVLHKRLTERASEIFGENLRPTYAGVMEYKNGGSLTPHVDNSDCAFTLDFCLEQDVKWPIYIEHKKFDLLPSLTLAYMGADQVHHRGIFKGNSSRIALFHYVKDE